MTIASAYSRPSLFDWIAPFRLESSYQKLMHQPIIPDKISTHVLFLGSDGMITGTLEIYQINNKRYVRPRAAARYLEIAEDLLQALPFM